jgi:hypothetical protein
MRLISAEILKLRRRRGLMIWSALLAIAPPVVAYGILAGLHVAAPDVHGLAGGSQNLQDLLGLVAVLGGVAGILIGTTAGSQDVSAGVFRDLVVTGRSRRSLFDARMPGALAVYLPLLAVGFGLAVGGSYAFAGGLPTAGADDLAGYAGWILATGILDVALGVVLASIVSARVATGVLVAWNAFLAPLLMQIDALGGARKAIDTVAALSLAPAGTSTDAIAMSTGGAIVVIAIWVGAALRVGGLWTMRRDA